MFAQSPNNQETNHTNSGMCIQWRTRNRCNLAINPWLSKRKEDLQAWPKMMENMSFLHIYFTITTNFGIWSVYCMSAFHDLDMEQIIFLWSLMLKRLWGERGKNILVIFHCCLLQRWQRGRLLLLLIMWIMENQQGAQSHNAAVIENWSCLKLKWF